MTTGGVLISHGQTGIHERAPIILGCARDVDTIVGYYAEEAAASGAAAGDVPAGAGSAEKRPRSE